jgi:Carboxypeptidase regulatory-like domain/TonB dependent receptor-like, beta-barrel
MRLARMLRAFEGKCVLSLLTLGLLLTLGTAQKMNAQILYGSMVGNVTDPSGAAVPGATVTVTQTQTQLTRKATTDQAGQFSLTTLAPGTYNVKVTAQGFKSFTQTGVDVVINSVKRVDASLELGAVNQSVEVSATAAVLQTERADVHHDLTANTIENVPVPPGNNFEQLFRAIPGFNPPVSAHSVATNPSRSLQFNVNGASSYGNDVRVDGMSQYNIWVPENVAYIPSEDAIQTVNVATNNFTPEQGLAGGSSINVVIKSGTNDFHGDLYEFHYDNALEAHGFFDPRNHITRVPKDVFNQFGGSIGGPIKKDKLFFFGNLEFTRQRQFATTNANVPSPAMVAGDMRGLDLSTGNTDFVYDPTTGNADGTGRTPIQASDNPASPDYNSVCTAAQANASGYCTNVIPTSRISPIAAKLAALYPAPNLPSANSQVPNNNYLAAEDILFNRLTSDSKIDWNYSDKLRVNGHLGLAKYNTLNPQIFGAGGGPQVSGFIGNEGRAYGHTISFSITSSYVFTPTFVVDVIGGMTRMVANSEQLDVKTNEGLNLGIPGTNGTRPFEGSWPEFDVNGGTSGGTSPWALLGTQHNFMPYYRNDPQFHYGTNASWVKGKHTLRFGADIIGQHLNEQQPEWNGGGNSYGPQGGFSFGTNPTACNNGATCSTSASRATNGYNNFASFLLGVDTAYGKNIQVPDYFHTITHEYGFYFGDQWQTTSKLTTTLGVRWEYFPVPTRGGGRGLERFDFSNNNMMLCGVGGNPITCGVTVDKKDFAPRLGLAYRATSTLVLRGGYGITYEPYNLVDNLRTNFPVLIPLYVSAPDSYSATGALDAVGQANAPVGETLPVGIPIPTLPSQTSAEVPVPGNVAITTTPNHINRGYIQSWNLTVEKQFGGWLASAGYVASRTIRQLGTLNLNVGSPIAPSGCVPAGTKLASNSCGGNASTPFGYLNPKSTPTAGCPDAFASTDLGCRTQGTGIVTPLTNNHYDSLQASLSHHFANGYQVQFNYTWSKTIGMAGVENEKSTASIQVPSFYNLNRGLANIDRPQNFEAIFMAESPFGAKKRWVSSGVGAKILGGWQINGLVSAVSGLVVGMSANGSLLNASGNSQRPDIVGPIKITKNAGPGQTWFDTSAFAGVDGSPATPDQRFGTSTFYAFHGPGLFNMDAGISRDFKLTERLGLQVKAQAINLTNTAYFNNPNSSCGSYRSATVTCSNAASGTFGQVTSTNSLAREGIDARQIEFSVKLSF